MFGARQFLTPSVISTHARRLVTFWTWSAHAGHPMLGVCEIRRQHGRSGRVAHVWGAEEMVASLPLEVAQAEQATFVGAAVVAINFHDGLPEPSRWHLGRRGLEAHELFLWQYFHHLLRPTGDFGVQANLFAWAGLLIYFCD